MKSLYSIQKWYSKKCNGRWEQTNGMMIHARSNEGWLVKIGLGETEFENKELVLMKERSAQDYIHCRIGNGNFKGFGGPENLEEILETFIIWLRIED